MRERNQILIFQSRNWVHIYLFITYVRTDKKKRDDHGTLEKEKDDKRLLSGDHKLKIGTQRSLAIKIEVMMCQNNYGLEYVN